MQVSKKQKTKRALSQIFYPYFLISHLLNHRPKFVVLMYHSVNPKHQCSIRPAQFEKQIKFIKENYLVFRLKNLLANQTMQAKINVAITFDDGFQDNFTYALPLLKKYQMPATFFITTGFITQQLDITKDWNCYNGLKPLNPSQIKEMAKSGMDFGAHTHAHPILTKIPLAKAREEIKKSKEVLEKILEKHTYLFAYPQGQKNTFNDKTKNILKDYGFRIACTTIWGANSIHSDPLKLKRIRIDPEDNLRDLKNKIEGKWDYINFFHLLKF